MKARRLRKTTGSNLLQAAGRRLKKSKVERASRNQVKPCLIISADYEKSFKVDKGSML